MKCPTLKGGPVFFDLSDFAEISQADRTHQIMGASAFRILKKFGGRPPGRVKVDKIDPFLEGCHRRAVNAIDLIFTLRDAATPQDCLCNTSRGWYPNILGSDKRKTEFV